MIVVLLAWVVGMFLMETAGLVRKLETNGTNRKGHKRSREYRRMKIEKEKERERDGGKKTEKETGEKPKGRECMKTGRRV